MQKKELVYKYEYLKHTKILEKILMDEGIDSIIDYGDQTCSI